MSQKDRDLTPRIVSTGRPSRSGSPRDPRSTLRARPDRLLSSDAASPLIERASGRLIGRAGLWQPEGWPGIEVSWIVTPSAWNQGYATEIGRAVRDHAFQQLGIRHLISVIGPDNLALIRVAEKIGSTFEREVEIRGTPQAIYGQRAPGA